MSVLLGNGDGTFQTAQSCTVGIQPSSVAVGAFNGDGYLDLAVANQYSGSGGSSGMVSILLGNGDGTFQAAQNYAAGSVPCSVAIGDFNRDGIADLAVATLLDGTVSILLGQGDGNFQAARTYAAGSYPNAMVVGGDFNGDSYPDLAVASAGGVAVLLNAGDWASPR